MQEYTNMYSGDIPTMYSIFLANEKDLHLLSHILVIHGFKKSDPFVGWYNIVLFLL